nr:histone H5, AT hook-like protein [Tanacetum cinerariifolium]
MGSVKAEIFLDLAGEPIRPQYLETFKEYDDIYRVSGFGPVTVPWVGNVLRSRGRLKRFGRPVVNGVSVRGSRRPLGRPSVNKVTNLSGLELARPAKVGVFKGMFSFSVSFLCRNLFIHMFNLIHKNMWLCRQSNSEHAWHSYWQADRPNILGSTELDLLYQKVEKLVVGAPCAVIDHMAFAYGKANKLLPMVFQDLNAKLRDFRMARYVSERWETHSFVLDAFRDTTLIILMVAAAASLALGIKTEEMFVVFKNSMMTDLDMIDFGTMRYFIGIEVK